MQIIEVPAGARAAIEALVLRDPDFATVERAAGPLPWRTRPAGFAGFLQAIVSQQISNRAAAAIWGRVTALPGVLEPEGLLALPDEALRAAGLSRPKIAHARALAEAVFTRALDPEAIPLMDDDDAIAAISSVRGLGRWTAEIYLLFALGRHDVFPAGDLALAASAAHLKRLSTRPDPRALRALAETWRARPRTSCSPAMASLASCDRPADDR